MRGDNENPIDMAASKAAKKKIKPKAYCLSFKCSKKADIDLQVDTRIGKARSVDVPKSTVSCPHCGHALFWVCEEDSWRAPEVQRKENEKSA